MRTPPGQLRQVLEDLCSTLAFVSVAAAAERCRELQGWEHVSPMAVSRVLGNLGWIRSIENGRVVYRRPR